MANRKNRPVIEVNRISVGNLKGLFSKGRIATVNFTKKKDGSNRTLNGVTKALGAMVGGEPAYDAESRGQVRIADVNVYKDSKGNRVPRHTAYRTVTVDNINWVTSGGKKYVVVHPVPELNFIQKQRFAGGDFGNLYLTLSGVDYVYHNVPRTKHQGLIEAENKGEYFNDQIKPYYSYTRLS